MAYVAEELPAAGCAVHAGKPVSTVAPATASGMPRPTNRLPARAAEALRAFHTVHPSGMGVGKGELFYIWRSAPEAATAKRHSELALIGQKPVIGSDVPTSTGGSTPSDLMAWGVRPAHPGSAQAGTLPAARHRAAARGAQGLGQVVHADRGDHTDQQRRQHAPLHRLQ